MDVYFVFSDEAGAYKAQRGQSFLRAHPFFCRSAIMLRADEWRAIRLDFENLRGVYELPTGSELKWSYVHSIYGHRRRGEEIPSDKPYSLFSHLSDDQLLGFVSESLALLRHCEHCRVVYTFTDNKAIGQIERARLYEMHVQDIMQRTEMELQSFDGLGIFFLDPSNAQTDQHLRDAYASLYTQGDFIANYQHVKDSLAFEVSQHSFGIRLADYAAGVFNGFLRTFETSTTWFQELVWPVLRKSPGGDALGYGIIEIPKRDFVREAVRQRLSEIGLL